MQGRIEHKISKERELQNKINNMPNYIKDFYYSLNEKSHTTKDRYINNVIRFLNNYTNGNINSLNCSELRNISAMDIKRYMSDITYFENGNEQNELKPATKACIYSSINAFFSFLYKNDYIENDPFSKGISRPKIQENDVVFLTPEEVKKVESNILGGYGSELSIKRQMAWKYRDYLLFRIPVVCGLRVTALCEINIEDIDFDDNSIRVTEKGNITKKVYLDDKTFEYINKWISDRRDLLDGEECRCLFISNQKQRMTVRSVERLIEKYTKNIIGKHITPHKLRSTCGTNLYQANKDIYLVAKVLGHKSTAPTRRYTKVFESDKRDAINTVAKLYS